MRMAGHHVLMVSGTDEHGTPIQVQADAEGMSTRELADRWWQPDDGTDASSYYFMGKDNIYVPLSDLAGRAAGRTTAAAPAEARPASLAR